MLPTNYKLTVHTPFDKLTTLEANQIVSFLFEHLEEYGDKKNDIFMAIQYAMRETTSPGGFVLKMTEVNGKIAGAVVVNKTGMEGYIPENILVYIAVHTDHRGKGIGKKLMQAAIKQANGDIALHVEPDNPAKFLYEKLGFENKYLEMRLKNPS
ncbi:MAG: GNAT family N-acetyltransferase [Saprospiraceae bacterium]|jgi:ribosomal protein S18 acetylase RimI-like enzyme